MWYHARMDKNAAHLAILNRFLDRLPRLYSVRWQDDEVGWRSMQVIAQSEDEATSIVQPIAGEVHLKAYRCAL